MGRTARTAGALLATTLLIALGACGDDDDGQLSVDLGSTTTAPTGDDSTTTSAAATGPTIPETATSLGTVPDDLPDGTYFGYITTLLVGDVDISGQFDLAELLTGQAALDATLAAGYEEPTDYFIKNDNEKLRPILVAPDAEVTDVDYDDCCDSKPTTIVQFVADRDTKGEERTAVALTVEDGRVTKIDEIYFP